MATAYPKRPRYFAHRFMRVLIKSCAAQDIGQDGLALLTVVAMTEDSKRYSDAVTFWNEQLEPLAGFRNWDQLNRTRARVIAAGWLHYEPGGRSKVGRYWVTIPDHLEVLDDQPVGEDDPHKIRALFPAGADDSLRETRIARGSNTDPSADDALTACGLNAEPSYLSLNRSLAGSQSAAEPTLDPDEQDITKPSRPSADVPRSEVSRGSQNDTVRQAVIDADHVAGLGTWIRWRVSDEERTRENRQTITMLIERYGLGEVQRTCEALVMSGDPERPSRPPGSKCWPDEILPAILAARSQAAGSTQGANPPQPTPLPEIVTQAHALLARHGAAACRVAMGWAPTVAPTDHAMRAALERLPVATELVLALCAQPALAT